MICPICERSCYIAEGGAGACGMYRNSGNAVEELYPNHYLLVCPISVETMPMLHFHPVVKFSEITEGGRNFDILGCACGGVERELGPSRVRLKERIRNQVMVKTNA